MSESAFSQLHAFLSCLHRGHAEVPSTDAPPGAESLSLPLTLALLRDLDLRRRGFAPGLQVAVLGPTQAGKSSVVNLLLGRSDAAGVSPLAGYTRTLDGFLMSGSDSAPAVQEFLDAGLDRSEYHLVHVAHPAGAAAAPMTVWDTPDFDSVSSRGYRKLIVEVVALADLILIVVSKDKYADLSVWQMLDLLHPLQRPTWICLNKIGTDSAVILESLRQRLAASRLDPELPVFELPFVSNGDLHGTAQASSLRLALHENLAACDNGQRQAGLSALLEAHWSAWTAPVRWELTQRQEWTEAVHDIRREALAYYREQYLDHGQHYATFKQAVIRLLELLEIPGLARPLLLARRALTWPLRKVFGLEDTEASGSRDGETEILIEAFEHAALTARTTVNERAMDPAADNRWFQALDAPLAARVPELRGAVETAVAAYRLDFEAEIQAAARSLYRQLEKNPAVLNGLRAARFTADAAGVLVALKTGAVGLNEAVLTPAVLAVTSFLTESAVGQYMQTVQTELKARQLEQVERLLCERFSEPLLHLAVTLDDVRLFGISEAELAAAEDLRQSLR